MLGYSVIIRQYGLRQLCKSAVAFYSRRSDSKSADVYKVVKSAQTIDDFESTTLGSSPNWELLGPRGYRFYLPGSIGPGWHDALSVAQVENVELQTSHYGKILHKGTTGTFECILQDCPILLRTGVMELFPAVDFSDGELTVISLVHEADLKHATRSKGTDAEKEKIAKCFVVAAQDICNKLKMAGFWADFINPFSGRPYLSPFQNLALYETDEKFRCLGFQIEDRGFCKIIENDERRVKNFVGNLFTTAPSSITKLKEVLNQYE